MAKYINDFSGDTVGGLPSNFSFGVFVPPTGSISDHWQVTADAAASGGKVLRFTGAGGGTNYNFPAIWDLVPSSEHQRARFRWRAGQNISDLRLFARSSVSDTVDEPTGYTLGVRAADLDINKYVAGSFTNFANDTTGYIAQAGTWYLTECEVVGINPTVLRVKSWPESGTKPTTWEELGGGPEGAVNDDDATDIESGGFGFFCFDADAQVDIDWLVVTTAGEEPEFTTTPTIRKGSTFDVETTLSGTVTAATLNGVTISDHITGQVGTTVSFNSAFADEITTSGTYDLVLTDDSADPDETLSVQVNVLGFTAFTIQHDGVIEPDVTGVKVWVHRGLSYETVEIGGATYPITGGTGQLGPIDVSDNVPESDDVGSLRKVSLLMPDGTRGNAFEAALELI